MILNLLTMRPQSAKDKTEVYVFSDSLIQLLMLLSMKCSIK